MKIIISGVTGFVGAHMMRHFSAQGHEVVGISRGKIPPPALLTYGKYISADLTIPFSEKLTADACIHCAGYANDKGSWKDFKRNNVRTTENIFQGIECPLFINMSSASIYPLLPEPIKESDVNPAAFPSFYGKSKWLAEEFTRLNAGEKDSVISLRPRAIYGTHDRILLPRILNIGKSGSIKLPGDGRIQLSMTNIENLIHATALALQSDKKGFHVYNVADAQSYQLRSVFQHLISGIKGIPIPVKAIPKSLVKTIIKVTSLIGKPFPLTMQAFDYITKPTLLNIDKIKKELDYAPTGDFEKSLPAIVDWAKSVDPEIWQKHQHLLPWSGNTVK